MRGSWFCKGVLFSKTRLVREIRANDHVFRRVFPEVFYGAQLPTDLRYCVFMLGFAAVAPLIAGGVKRVWPSRPSPLHGIRAAGDLWRNRCARAETDRSEPLGLPPRHGGWTLVQRRGPAEAGQRALRRHGSPAAMDCRVRRDGTGNPSEKRKNEREKKKTEGSWRKEDQSGKCVRDVGL